jgi:hypothetical protein
MYAGRGQLGHVGRDPPRLVEREQLDCGLAAEWPSTGHTVVWPSACLSIALVPSSFVVRHFGCAAGANMMKAKLLRTAGFPLFFLLSVFAPAQAATSGPSTEPPSRLSALVHDFTTWLNHVTGARAKNHQAGLFSPPLPRPRPAADPASMPVASNKEWSEFVPPPVASKKKMPTPIQIND